MAVYAKTTGITGAQLLARIKEYINDDAIRTWAFEESTGFVHTTSNGQWNRGWYMEVESHSNNELVVYCKKTEESVTPEGTYGVLNGRFAEMLLNHFKGLVKEVIIKDQRP